MTYKILEQNGVENENIDGAAFNFASCGGKDGILKGVLNECTLYSPSSNSVELMTGELLLSGFRVKITSPYRIGFSTRPSSDTQYQIVAKITLDPDRNVQFQLTYGIDRGLTKDNLFVAEKGVYEVEIGRFTHDINGSVINVSRSIGLLPITQPEGNGGQGSVDLGPLTEQVNRISEEVENLAMHKADLPQEFEENNIVIFAVDGNPKDSGVSIDRIYPQVSSWADVKNLCNLGIADRLLEVGDQFEDTYLGKKVNLRVVDLQPYRVILQPTAPTEEQVQLGDDYYGGYGGTLMKYYPAGTIIWLVDYDQTLYHFTTTQEHRVGEGYYFAEYCNGGAEVWGVYIGSEYIKDGSQYDPEADAGLGDPSSYDLWLENTGELVANWYTPASDFSPASNFSPEFAAVCDRSWTPSPIELDAYAYDEDAFEEREQSALMYYYQDIYADREEWIWGTNDRRIEDCWTDAVSSLYPEYHAVVGIDNMFSDIEYWNPSNICNCYAIEGE